MTWRTWVAVGAVVTAGIGGFWIGRQGRSVEVKESVIVKTRTVMRYEIVTKQVETEKQRRNVTRQTRTEERPDGTKITTSTSTDRSVIDSSKTVDLRATGNVTATTDSETARKIDVPAPDPRNDWAVQAYGSWIPGAEPWFGGGDLQRRIVGDLWIGAGARRSQGGKWEPTASLRLEF